MLAVDEPNWICTPVVRLVAGWARYFQAVCRSCRAWLHAVCPLLGVSLWLNSMVKRLVTLTPTAVALPLSGLLAGAKLLMLTAKERSSCGADWLATPTGLLAFVSPAATSLAMMAVSAESGVISILSLEE